MRKQLLPAVLCVSFWRGLRLAADGVQPLEVLRWEFRDLHRSWLLALLCPQPLLLFLPVDRLAEGQGGRVEDVIGRIPPGVASLVRR